MQTGPASFQPKRRAKLAPIRREPQPAEGSILKATIKGPDGKFALLIGLTFANLDRFRAEPGDTFIKIKGDEIGLPFDVMIFSRETEAHCAQTLEGGIGPETKIIVSPRLRQ